jgi:uncharacterized membrane protein
VDYLLKNAHFIFIHFPIAALICSLLFDVLATVWKKKEWHSAALLTLIVGTLGAIASVATGPEDRNPLLHTHELFGKITMVVFIILTLIRLYVQYKKSRDIGNNYAYLTGALIGVLLLSYTGHLGGQMVHKPKGAFHPNQQQQQQQPKSSE